MADCWNLLEGRREHYLPRGEREPEAAYRRRVEAALPSGFFRDALRTFAGMLSRENWTALPSGLELVLSDVDGRGTDLLNWQLPHSHGLPVRISWRQAKPAP